MPTTATLLLRDQASACPLSALVEKSQHQRHLSSIAGSGEPTHELRLTSCQLELIRLHASAPDEGFESDIDSIVSSDGSIAPDPPPGSKTPETDSANGSAGSDSDTETSDHHHQGRLVVRPSSECCNLVDCVCYTDVSSPHILVFVIRQSEALVFRFHQLDDLNAFYLNFTALKALANQKTYSSGSTQLSHYLPKFNLLQRTDHNGVTHIEITRDQQQNGGGNSLQSCRTQNGPSSIISLNTPETSSSSSSSSSSPSSMVMVPRKSENLVNNELRKVWTPSRGGGGGGEEEEAAATPQRPERKKKKGKAPLPPVTQSTPPSSLKAKSLSRQSLSGLFLNKLSMSDSNKPLLPLDVMRGEYVKVNVPEPQPLKFVAKGLSGSTQHQVWTNSVPRMLKKRSRSETRNFTPMAYRYVDTTPSYGNHPNMGNRLFGLSPRLREFGPQHGDARWGSVGELHKGGLMMATGNENNLKSVIKNNKEDNRSSNSSRKQEKKVTFSAYATVQVV